MSIAQAQIRFTQVRTDQQIYLLLNPEQRRRIAEAGPQPEPEALPALPSRPGRMERPPIPH
jgi:Spy/CpxP family protein refolding chaperone